MPAEENGSLALRPLGCEPDEWTRVSPLIAHAGGAVREMTFNFLYTNSVEALEENYSLGHRVFEFDFCLTSDGKLASVHDWDSFGYRNGTPLSSEQWKEWRGFGKPVTRGRYHTMLVDDILDQMMVNRDMFIVTDTKSTKISEEETRLQFELIRDAALCRDPELINRIVPQIYNAEMYSLIMSVYPWSSIIYSIYATGASADEIIDFTMAHDNIHVITVPANGKRIRDAEIARIHDGGRLVYAHTLNNYQETVNQLVRGVDGLYTDLLCMDEYERYRQTAKALIAKGYSYTDDPADRYFVPLQDLDPTFTISLGYLASLENCVILMSVRDEATNGLTYEAKAALARLGLRTDLTGQNRCSYIAVIDDGAVIVENMAYEQIDYAGKLPDGTQYAMVSAGYECGDVSSIVIIEKEFSPNKRGFNIVVYNKELHTVIHQGNYDTFSAS